MRRAERIVVAILGDSRTTVPVSSGQNRQPLLDTQPENGSWQGVVAAGASAERQRQGGLSNGAHHGLGIHNMTNLLDGKFADLKRKLGCHHGMRKVNKVRFIKDYFSLSGDE